MVSRLASVQLLVWELNRGLGFTFELSFSFVTWQHVPPLLVETFLFSRAFQSRYVDKRVFSLSFRLYHQERALSLSQSSCGTVLIRFLKSIFCAMLGCVVLAVGDHTLVVLIPSSGATFRCIRAYLNNFVFKFIYIFYLCW